MNQILASVFLVLSATSLHAAVITYDVRRTIGDDTGTGFGTVTGFIKTDGTLGPLTDASKIVDWSFTLTAPNLNDNNPVFIELFAGDEMLTPTGTTILNGAAVTATATHLLYDFDLPVTETHHLLFQGNSGYFWCLETKNCSDAPNLTEHLGLRLAAGTETFQFTHRSGMVPFATAVIPVPAAIWLFGSGLVGLIGFASRKH